MSHTHTIFHQAIFPLGAKYVAWEHISVHSMKFRQTNLSLYSDQQQYRGMLYQRNCLSNHITVATL